MHFIMRLNNFVYHDLSTNNKNRGSFISEYFQYFQMVSLELKSFPTKATFSYGLLSLLIESLTSRKLPLSLQDK